MREPSKVADDVLRSAVAILEQQTQDKGRFASGEELSYIQVAPHEERQRIPPAIAEPHTERIVSHLENSMSKFPFNKQIPILR